jgi:hypothetical protein
MELPRTNLATFRRKGILVSPSLALVRWRRPPPRLQHDQPRTSGSNVRRLMRTMSLDKQGATFAHCITIGTKSSFISRNTAPVRYPIKTSLFPISLPSGGWPRPKRPAADAPWRAASDQLSSIRWSRSSAVASDVFPQQLISGKQQPSEHF